MCIRDSIDTARATLDSFLASPHAYALSNAEELIAQLEAVVGSLAVDGRADVDALRAIQSVSYTHLDVSKRQLHAHALGQRQRFRHGFAERIENYANGKMVHFEHITVVFFHYTIPGGN